MLNFVLGYVLCGLVFVWFVADSYNRAGEREKPLWVWGVTFVSWPVAAVYVLVNAFRVAMQIARGKK